MTSIDEIDARLVAVYWRRLHAEWAGADFDAALARAEQDALLDERFALTSPGAMMRARTAYRIARIPPAA